MKRALFIDRDGTLIVEPKDDYQVDSLGKLEFLPGVFQWLGRISRELDFELVIVTNQDGLCTESFPEETFWPAQNKMLQAFENEGIVFSDILIDKTLPKENAPTRKPGIGMFDKYLGGEYDLKNSYVIGDRLTDLELASNLGAMGILVASKNTSYNAVNEEFISYDWKGIFNIVANNNRSADLIRKTSETEVSIALNLDGNGVANISTGLAFFDHMLDQIARHSGVDLSVKVEGDLEIDEHHTIEDTAIVLGQVFKLALGSKRGIERYGFCLPMDDCLAQVALDFGGRNWIEWRADFNREMIGKMPTEMFFHFFKSFSDGAKANLNIRAEGINEHHKIESIFKAFAKAIKMAINQDQNTSFLPTTKGVL